MGSSYVGYRGKGFWSWDGYLEHLLVLLADSIPASETNQWLLQARDHWREQASGIFGGWIHPMFDEYCATEERRVVLVGMVKSLLGRNDLTAEVRETAELLLSLLNSEMETDASSPLDYMVTGTHPYRWRRE